MGSIESNKNHNNFKNALIAFLVPFPSLLFYLAFLNHYNDNNANPLWVWCFHHPLLLANILFFINVNLLFWLIGNIQSSHWMIDPYWTVIPLMLVHFYANHPLAGDYNIWRSRIVILLTWTWSIRLSHNYFRRENWQWGAREDWRFTDLSNQYGKNWWWISFFAVYLSQQGCVIFSNYFFRHHPDNPVKVFLMGICMPFYVVHAENMKLNIWDLVATLACLSGVVIAYYADTQLYHFVSKNLKLKEQGNPVVPNLDSGLWRYSRHPNYFGEQLWWWGLCMFAWNLGHGWAFIGALVNSLVLAHVTKLVEDRMLKQDYRAEAYRQYQKETSVLIPWFKSSSHGKDKSA